MSMKRISTGRIFCVNGLVLMKNIALSRLDRFRWFSRIGAASITGNRRLFTGNPVIWCLKWCWFIRGSVTRKRILSCINFLGAYSPLNNKEKSYENIGLVVLCRYRGGLLLFVRRAMYTRHSIV